MVNTDPTLFSINCALWGMLLLEFIEFILTVVGGLYGDFNDKGE